MNHVEEMDLLPDDAILHIFTYLGIIGKKNFNQIQKKYNIIMKDLVRKCNRDFINNFERKHHYKMWMDKLNNLSMMERLTLELCFDNCPIPVEFIIKTNKVVIYALITGGFLDLLKIAKDKDCKFDRNMTYLAVCYDQLDVLKWLHENCEHKYYMGLATSTDE